MSDEKHSPGPWTWVECTWDGRSYETLEDKHAGVVVGVPRGFLGSNVSKADAALIARAPDLLTENERLRAEVHLLTDANERGLAQLTDARAALTQSREQTAAVERERERDETRERLARYEAAHASYITETNRWADKLEAAERERAEETKNADYWNSVAIQRFKRLTAAEREVSKLRDEVERWKREAKLYEKRGDDWNADARSAQAEVAKLRELVQRYTRNCQLCTEMRDCTICADARAAIASPPRPAGERMFCMDQLAYHGKLPSGDPPAGDMRAEAAREPDRPFAPIEAPGKGEG